MSTHVNVPINNKQLLLRLEILLFARSFESISQMGHTRSFLAAHTALTYVLCVSQFGEDGSGRSFVLEIRWSSEYPENEAAEVSMAAFYNREVQPCV